VIRTSRVSGRRPYALIVLGDELLVRKFFVLLVAPVFRTNLFVHVFGQGFCESVGQRFEQDAAVIVVVCLESLHVLVNAQPRSNRKAADEIVDSGLGGCNVIRLRLNM
jgi:hypothetical protein